MLYEVITLGGGECTMEEMVEAYRDLMNRGSGKATSSSPLSRGAAWLTLEALLKGTRPDEESLWESWASARNIAWKTGTSWGNRDAWAVGTTPLYTVGVWVGNATGEGRPELTSAGTSAPIMFEIFTKLGASGWPAEPEIELERVTVCSRSGCLAGPYCAETERALKPRDATQGFPCPVITSYSIHYTKLYESSNA